MTEISVEKDVVLSRISERVDSLQSQSTFQELDKHEMRMSYLLDTIG